MPFKKKVKEKIVIDPDKPVLDIIREVEAGSNLQPVALVSGRKVRDAVSSGCLVLDLISGGGWAPGRVTQIFGPEGSGKSTLMYESCAALHTLKVPTMFFDHEASSDPEYMKEIGMKIDDKSGLTRYYQPTHGAQTYVRILNILKRLPDKQEGPPQVAFIIDSIAAMPAPEEIEEPEKNPMGLRARLHSQWLGKIKTLIGKKRCALVAVNQIRMGNFGNPMANPETQPGGQAWRFYTDNMIRASKIEQTVEVKGELYNKMKMKTIKNKNFRPFQVGEVYIHLGHGISPASDVVGFLKLAGFCTSGKPSVIGLDEFAAKGEKFDGSKGSIAEFEAEINEDPTPWYRACRKAIADGSAVARYLAVQKDYTPKQLAAGEHLNDPELVKDLKGGKKKKGKGGKGKSSKKGITTKSEPADDEAPAKKSKAKGKGKGKAPAKKPRGKAA